jgi:hypothetical protein
MTAREDKVLGPMNSSFDDSPTSLRAAHFAALLLASVTACRGSSVHDLTSGCTQNEFECSSYSGARARLLRPPAAETDPYDSEAGTCGSFQYLKHREERVPTDQQESTIITRYYNAGGTLAAVRVAHNFDSSGSFKVHSDYGSIPVCTLKKLAVLNPAKSYWRRP